MYKTRMRKRTPNKLGLLSIFLFSLLWFFSDVVLAASDENERWLFTLTKGQDQPVCQAYLKRLNLGEQAKFPFCDRPETGVEYGFYLLKRVPVSAELASQLAPRVFGFTNAMNQDAEEIGNAQLLRLKKPPREWLSVASARERLGRDINVWRYDPEIDVDNDGKPDDIIVWEGYPADSGLHGCGWKDKWDNPKRVTRAPMFIDRTSGRIDLFNTLRIFSHPSAGYSFYEQTPTNRFDRFSPIGTTIGFFKFGDVYYFDTFFNYKGDFHGQRKNDPRIEDTLGVFLYRNSEVRQMCEFAWHNPQNNQKP